MPLIPAEHASYGLLAEVLDKSRDVLVMDDYDLLRRALASSPGLTAPPDNLRDAGDYIAALDAQGQSCAAQMLRDCNDKLAWSVCRFVGDPRAAAPWADLTYGRCYYWPCHRVRPAYLGVLSNGAAVPVYLPPAGHWWRVELDPTGMARRALSQAGAYTVRVLYLRDVPPLAYTPGGDWIDLSCAQETALHAGESARLPLGIAVRLPEGCEAHVLPRSSTFARYGIVQTNGMGIVDESYCGAQDEWMLPVYAVRDTVVPFGARICQFRAVQKMPPVRFETVTNLAAPSRGGFGSTGT